MNDAEFESLLLPPDAALRRAMETLNQNRSGIAIVVDSQRHLLGTVTDGDIRRALLSGASFDTPCRDFMMTTPVTVPVGTPHSELLEVSRAKSVRQIPVVDDKNKLISVHFPQDPQKRASGEKYRAVVMAGGLGSRLGELTTHTPKPLIEVGGKPILEHIINHLASHGVDQIFIATRYLAEKIENYFGAGERWNVTISYVREQKRLGTAGGLKSLEGYADRPFLVMNGDLLSDFDVIDLFSFHDENDAALTVAVRHYEFEVPYGVVEVDGLRVSAISEKPTYDFFVNAGIYIVDPALLDYIPADEMFDITELIQLAVDRGHHVVCFPIVEQWIDVGRPPDLARAERLLKGHGIADSENP